MPVNKTIRINDKVYKLDTANLSYERSQALAKLLRGYGYYTFIECNKDKYHVYKWKPQKRGRKGSK